MKNFEEIRRFLNKEMTKEEVLAFQQRVSKEEDLAVELKIQRLEELAIEQMVQENTLRVIKEEREKKRKPKPSRRISPFWLWAAAAAIAALIVGVFFFSNPTKMTIAQAAQAEYRKNPMKIGQLRTGDPAVDLQRQKHWQSLSLQDSAAAAAAILFFKSPTSAKDTLARHLYFLGHAYMVQQKYPEAITSFQSFLQTPRADTRLLPFARYYLLLNYLSLGNIPKAKDVMESINENGDDNFFVEISQWKQKL